MNPSDDLANSILWECNHFSKLTSLQLYEILQLRNEVFVVEQNCPYQDCDNKDKDAMHITAYSKNKLVAYSRIISPGIAYPGAASIGRVLTAPDARKKEIGKSLMKYSIQQCESMHKSSPIIIAAQLYLERFYMQFGFERSSQNFLEDNIPHLMMFRASGEL
ncbi:MAG: GNAT family N-acetyltransferase [Ginsengibacter sp.]